MHLLGPFAFEFSPGPCNLADYQSVVLQDELGKDSDFLSETFDFALTNLWWAVHPTASCRSLELPLLRGLVANYHHVVHLGMLHIV